MVPTETFMAQPECPQMHHGHSATDPVTLSNAQTKPSIQGDTRLDILNVQDDAKILAHYSDTLGKMVQSLMDLEDRYFKALCKVIQHTERALHDISHINSLYVSCLITVMPS